MILLKILMIASISSKAYKDCQRQGICSIYQPGSLKMYKCCKYNIRT